MKNLFFFLTFFISCAALGQDVINIDGIDCDLHGSSRPGSKTYYLNGFKNRYHFPSAGDFYHDVTFDALMHSADPNEFSQDRALTLSGYVFNVKTGGVETCNCKTKDPAYRDTHIELTPD